MRMFKMMLWLLTLCLQCNLWSSDDNVQKEIARFCLSKSFDQPLRSTPPIPIRGTTRTNSGSNFEGYYQEWKEQEKPVQETKKVKKDSQKSSQDTIEKKDDELLFNMEE